MRETFAICPTCEGSGKHVNPSIDSQGISPEEFYSDPDFEEAYFGGAYDVTCVECQGNRVVEACETDGCSEPREAKQSGWGDRRDSTSHDHFATCYEHLSVEELDELRETADFYAEMAAERRMGA